MGVPSKAISPDPRGIALSSKSNLISCAPPHKLLGEVGGLSSS